MNEGELCMRDHLPIPTVVMLADVLAFTRGELAGVPEYSSQSS